MIKFSRHSWLEEEQYRNLEGDSLTLMEACCLKLNTDHLEL